MTITCNYRIYHRSPNIRVLPWLCFCLQCIHGMNFRIPGLYLPLLHPPDVITLAFYLKRLEFITHTAIELLRLAPEGARRTLTFKAALEFSLAGGAFKWVMARRY